mgnify:CR=1 FL=1
MVRGLDAPGVDDPQAGALIAAGGLAGEGMFPLPFLRVYDFFYNLLLIISEVG